MKLAPRTGGLALAAAAAVCAAVSLAQSDARRSVRDGVFSAAQVARGRRIFTTICVNCHEIEEFVGADAYLEKDADGKTVWEVFDFIWGNMPDDDPSSLEPEDYAAVLSYVLSVYGLPTGDADLPIEEEILKTIVIERPERPGI